MTRDKLSITSVLLKNHFFFIAGVKVKFRFERLQNKLRSSTFDNCEIAAWSSEICIISSDDGEDLFANKLLMYIRNAKLDTKWRSSKTKSRKENSRTALEDKFITLINTRFPRVFKARLQLSLARMYFVKV